MIGEIVRIAASALLVTGAMFSLIAAFGIVRLPDLYTRMHAASKAGTVGAGCILLGVAVASGDIAVGLRALAGIVFLALTAPVAAHLLARAAYKAGYRHARSLAINDLEAEADRGGQ